jgi:hypothetical protein
MQKHLEDLSREAGVAPEWKELLRDLDRLQQVRLQHRGADWLVRADAALNVTALFRAAHVALPPRAQQTAPPKPAASSKSAPKRRGRQGVVPQRLEFRCKRQEVRGLSKLGVQVGPRSGR